MTQGYSLEENFRPFAEVVAWNLDDRLSDADWDAIVTQLEGTDADLDRWTTFKLHGSGGAAAVLRYAWTDPVAGVPYVSVRVEAAPAVEAAAATAIDIMQAYRLIPLR